MINFNSLYVFFFAITVGALAPTEASSVPVATNTGLGLSPRDIAFSADQHQQNNNVTPVQKEGSQGSLHQKKSRLGSVLATAGATALVLAFVFFFIKHMKAYIAEEKEEKVRPLDEVDQPKKKPPPAAKEEEEEEDPTTEKAIILEMGMIGQEVVFVADMMTEQERRDEAKRRIKRRGEIYTEMKKKDPHGRKTLPIRKATYKQEAWERTEEKGRRYNYAPDQAQFEKAFEDEWLERQIRIEAAALGLEIGSDDEIMTEQERRDEAGKRIKAREEEFQKIRCAAGAEGRTELELRKRAAKNEAWKRQKERWDEEAFDAEWKIREELQERLLGQ